MDARPSRGGRRRDALATEPSPRRIPRYPITLDKLFDPPRKAPVTSRSSPGWSRSDRRSQSNRAGFILIGASAFPCARKYAVWPMRWRPLPSKVSCGTFVRSPGERAVLLVRSRGFESRRPP
jgi:hypothetical protein